MKKLVVLGCNPALQKTLFFEHFDYGEVNRAQQMEICASGKGINFCRAAKCYNLAMAELIQFAGGDNGEYICSELTRENIPAHTSLTQGPTRCCITCLDRSNSMMTELIEPSFAATELEVENLLENFSNALHGCSAAAICGTLPTGTTPEVYRRAGITACKAGIPLLLDAYRSLDTFWDTGVETVIKINRDELADLSGCPTVHQGLRWLFSRISTVKYAAITDGAATAYATDGLRLGCYSLPKLENVINPIGCGDTAGSIWLSELVNGSDPFEGFANGLAAASANCLTALPGSFDIADMRRIRKEIVYEYSTL